MSDVMIYRIIVKFRVIVIIVDIVVTIHVPVVVVVVGAWYGQRWLLVSPTGYECWYRRLALSLMGCTVRYPLLRSLIPSGK